MRVDRLEAMEAFVRVAESRSFSQAARHLGVSKSVISRHVSALEADLGARLLHRTTRSLTLTEVGQAYFDRCLRILADIAEANLSVMNLQADPRGKLRVNVPMSFGVHHLAPLVPVFLERYPEVEIEMALNDRFVSLVEEGVDVAVRIGKLEDSSLIARLLAPARRVVCASPAYLAKRGTPQSPDDLAYHCCLTYSNLSTSDEWNLRTAEGQRWPVSVRGRLRVNNGDMLCAAAVNGVGLIMIPTFLAGPYLRDGRLVSVLEEFVPQDIGVYAVYPHGRHLSPKVRAFVDFLAERFGPNPYWDQPIDGA